MTDTTTDQQKPDTATVESAPETKPSNREAAKYRKQLRDAEAERDVLKATVEQMQRTEVERLAGEHLAKGSALWASGIDLADLLDESGAVDPTAVANASTKAQEDLGLQARQRGPVIPNAGDTPDTQKFRPDFADAFGPNAHD